MTQQPSDRHDLSRRQLLQGLAALLLPITVEGCTQPSTSPAPTNIAPRHSPGSILYTYRGHSDRVTTVAWSPDGNSIASGSLDKTIQIWAANTTSHALTTTLRGHSMGVQAVAWSPGSDRVVSGSLDQTVRLWNALSGEQLARYDGHTDVVMAVCWSPDGKYVASASMDSTIRMWEVATGQLRYAYRGHKAGIHSLAWSPDGHRIASGSEDATVQVLDALTGQALLTYRGHTGTVSGVAWSPDSRLLASGSWDKTVQVWNSTSGTLSYIYHGYNVQAAKYDFSKGVLPDLILALAWSHSGKRLVAVTQVYCGDSCGVVISWDAYTQRNTTFYTDVPTFAIAWSPDDTHLVTSVVVSAQADVITRQANKTWEEINGAFVQIVQA